MPSVPPASLDPQSFKRATRLLAAGGVIVITAREGEERTGLTATSATSFSAELPSVLYGEYERLEDFRPLLGIGGLFGFF